MNEDDDSRRDAFDNVSQMIYVLSFLCENSEKATTIVSRFSNTSVLFLNILSFGDEKLEIAAG